jgi:hypothetical protein
MVSVVRDMDAYRSRRAPGRGVSDCNAGLERVYVIGLKNFFFFGGEVRTR